MSDPGAGSRLHGLLPQLYRAEDRDGHLRRLLDAFGGVLDELRQALEHRLADAFANHPEAQAWLLPYFADLVDARLAAPDEVGRREELAQAVLWRQRKGTAGIVSRMARTVGRYEPGTAGEDGLSDPLRVVEGWTRLAVTPRIGEPLLDLRYHDLVPVPDGSVGAAVRDPRLPAATVDFRRLSRKVRSAAAGGGERPLQLNPAGVPVFPDTSEDVSRRTPDLRPPRAGAGWIHPRRVLVFAEERSLFRAGWQARYPAAPDALYADLAKAEPHLVAGRTLDGGSLPGIPGPLVLDRCVVQGDLFIAPGPGADAADLSAALSDCIVTGRIVFGGQSLQLTRCSAGKVEVLGAGALSISESLVGSVAAAGPAEIFDSTLLQDLSAFSCDLRGSIVAGALALREGGSSCLSYSRIPPDAMAAYGPAGRVVRCSSAVPAFVSTTLGQRECGALAPGTSPEILAGAANGGEMGITNTTRDALRDRAVIEKLGQFLPAGMTVTLARDARTTVQPPAYVRSNPKMTV